jgi:monomeric sarcosine oxidase
MTTNNRYDVIVLGLGVMGSAAAYHLAKGGQRVLALEQFELDHRMGSSYGESRIIRYAYDYPIYVELAQSAFTMWRDLEREAGRQVMFTTGGFDFGAADYPTLVATRENLTAAGIPFEWLSAEESRQRFPMFKLDDNMRGLYQPDAGYLAASDCVKTQADMALKHGAVLMTNTPVLDVKVLNNSVRVRTADAEYEAGRLVITAGPWAVRVLAMLDLHLPMHASREEQVFFQPPNIEQFMPGRFPIFICHQKPWFYGLPNAAGTGVKAAIHPRNEKVDPDNMKRTPDDEYIEEIRGLVQRFVPAMDGKVNEARICLYTMTPDEHFVIDRHPAYPHVSFGAGFSGHGFKFGILIGRILADLATKGETPYDISLFSVKRFLPQSA